MSNENQEVKHRFARELLEWTKSGHLPESANQDVRYFLELQKERLTKRGLRMEYELVPPKNGKEFLTIGSYGRAYLKSKKYECFIDRRSMHKTISFYRDEKRVFRKKRKEVLLVTNTWLKGEDVTGEETYCCPSCGAISTVSKLQEGCPYCDARFVMSDLFPKVTGYSFVHDVVSDLDVPKAMKLFAMAGGILGVLLGFFSSVSQGLGATILGVLKGGFLGTVMGFYGLCMGIVFLSLPLMPVVLAVSFGKQNTKGQIVKLLGGFDPSFSFDFFVNQIITSVQTLFFAKDRANLAIYEGNELHPEFDAIVESVYNGEIRLNHYRVENGYCFLNLNVHMSNVYDTGRKLSMKNEIFAVTVVKNIRKQEDPGFSIKKVACSGCGGSFDATSERFCPYCRTSYDMKEDGWVILAIHKVK